MGRGVDTHGLSPPQLMVFWPPCPWNIDPPLPMVYQTLSYGIMNSSLLVEMRGVQNTMTKNWPRGQNTIWKIEPGVKISYVTLGSIYHGVQNTICIHDFPSVYKEVTGDESCNYQRISSVAKDILLQLPYHHKHNLVNKSRWLAVLYSSAKTIDKFINILPHNEMMIMIMQGCH
jgi:hypothetical protein